jgi:hypothetical protein
MSESSLLVFTVIIEAIRTMNNSARRDCRTSPLGWHAGQILDIACFFRIIWDMEQGALVELVYGAVK